MQVVQTPEPAGGLTCPRYLHGGRAKSRFISYCCVTSDYKHSSFKQDTFTKSQLCGPEVWLGSAGFSAQGLTRPKSRAWPSGLSLEAGGRIHFHAQSRCPDSVPFGQSAEVSLSLKPVSQDCPQLLEAA